MDTFNVYLIRFQPFPDESHQKTGFSSLQEARDYITNIHNGVVGHLWVIIKVPSDGNCYELIECITK